MIIRLAVASLMVASAAGAFFGDAAPRRAPGVSRAAVAAHSVRGLSLIHISEPTRPY